jgi:hypothetical protein
MNFITFSSDTTNIFPLANSVTGGQLLSEFNLRSQSSVGVGPTDADKEIQYTTGASYCHAELDFNIQMQTDDQGTVISNTILEILPGSALVNGHFVQNTAPMLIDLVQANIDAAAVSQSPVKGSNLVVGLRAIYSTEVTMNGAMVPENGDNMFEGIQVVILPEDQFKLPIDVPSNPNGATAHLKLGTFSYINNIISSITQNYPGKCQYIDMSRIASASYILDQTYVTKTNLNPKKLYVMGSLDGTAAQMNWTDAESALMVWDHGTTLTSTPPAANEAQFAVNTQGQVQLFVPHKQIPGMVDTGGRAQYFADKLYTLPKADFTAGTPGTVDKNYTNKVKDITSQIQQLYSMPAGKQRGYISVINVLTDLPTMNAAWNIGDYIVIGQDNVVGGTSQTTRAPATMYIVIPGIVSHITYVSSTTDGSVPSGLTGVEIARATDSNSATGGTAPNTSDAATYNSLFGIANGIYRGQVGVDYFTTKYINGATTTTYFYKVDTAGSRAYSDPVLITGQVPLATTSGIGGFYNVDDTYTDYGYVIIDSDGHLRLLDYALLRSGTLAYQLGQDLLAADTVGMTTAAIQSILDDRVNNRLAFPNAAQTASATDPGVINVYISLTKETSPAILNIYGIDSRFNTSVYLHILGTADSNTTINIFDCQKIRIDSNISGTPVINLYRCGLYYDPNVLDSLNTISGMTIWYEQFDLTDPNLAVSNMTVRDLSDPTGSGSTNVLDPWSTAVNNDNHFVYALRSITFDGRANIIAASIIVRNELTSDVSLGSFIVNAAFDLPQGTSLTYPVSRLTSQIKITGAFIVAYPTNSPVGYVICDTKFTAVTNVYDPLQTDTGISGNIAFYLIASQVNNIVGLPAGTPIDGWEASTWNEFAGTIL